MEETKIPRFEEKIPGTLLTLNTSKEILRKNKNTRLDEKGCPTQAQVCYDTTAPKKTYGKMQEGKFSVSVT